MVPPTVGGSSPTRPTGSFAAAYAYCPYATQCKTVITVVLTIKSDLDPHMIVELEDGLNKLVMVMLVIYLWPLYILILCWYVFIS
jgi:positive regulator of sigma E activity